MIVLRRSLLIFCFIIVTLLVLGPAMVWADYICLGGKVWWPIYDFLRILPMEERSQFAFEAFDVWWSTLYCASLGTYIGAGDPSWGVR